MHQFTKYHTHLLESYGISSFLNLLDIFQIVFCANFPATTVVRRDIDSLISCDTYACSIPWLVANRACLGHSRPACTTESSTTKNAPSFGRSLAGGVEEDTPDTDCQTHQEYESSLCSLHRCNRWTYAILTVLWGFICDSSDLPYKFSHSLLVLQTPTDGFLSVNEMM